MRLFGLVATALFWVFTGCGNCDDDLPLRDDLAGTYRMTSWNAPVAVDLNQDGVAHRNLMKESTCYDGSHLILHPDNRYTVVFRSARAAQDNVACDESADSGKWHQTTNSIYLESDEGATLDLAYGSVNQILTLSVENQNYPTVNTGEIDTATGPVNMVFSLD